MSLAPVGLQASVGKPSTTSPAFLSQEEQSYLAARNYRKAFERIRLEEELKQREKEERRRQKKAIKAVNKVQTESRTLRPKASRIARLKAYLKVKVLRRRR